jgi:DNA-binding NarL/FixJ family response regulator
MNPVKLTGRELLVIKLLSEGATNNNVAVLIKVKLSTVKTHIENARWKLDALNTTHLVAICIRAGWIE